MTSSREHTMYGEMNGELNYTLARQREEQMRRLARRAFQITPHADRDTDVTDVPATHRRWRVRWRHQVRPAV